MKSHPLLFRTAVSSLLTAALLLTLGGPAAAQLADGPWSMYRHDVCHTGQSPNLGPLFAGTPGVPGTPGATDVKIWHGFDKLRTSPSLSADGKTVYFGMGFDFCSVDAATMATNDCLLLPADVSDSSPAVGANGTVYMGDRDNSLNAYTSNPATKELTLKWRYNHGHEGDIWQHPVIAPASVPAGGHHLLRPRPVHRRGGHLHRPHRQRDIADGEVEVQDRQLRQAVLPGDRQQRHHLLRRSERLCLRLRGQGSLSGQWHASHTAGADLFVHHGTRGGPSCCGGSRSARLRSHRVARHLRGFEHALHRHDGRRGRHSHGPHRARHHQSVLGRRPAPCLRSSGRSRRSARWTRRPPSGVTGPCTSPR